MLTHLYIKNFALIEELSLEFSEGLTIITGETGAGKSILIGALNQVLGIRATADLVRSGSAKAVIEATLIPEKSDHLTSILDEAGIEPDETVILRREIHAKGHSRCFINDSPCTLQVLKKVGDLLIDLHGQHDHQLLLRPETHISMLDDYGRLTPAIDVYRTVFDSLSSKKKEYARLTADAKHIGERRDLLEYQFKELDALDPQKDEEATLQEEITLHEHAETRFSLCAELNELLYDIDRSVFVQLSDATEQLKQLARIDKVFVAHLQDAESAKSLVEELSRTVRDYSETIEFNHERLEMLRERQMDLQQAKRKYGRSLEELVDFREKIADELALENNLSERTRQLDSEIEALREKLSQLAAALSAERKKTAAHLEKAIEEKLAGLGIAHSAFRVGIRHEVAEEGNIVIDGKSYSTFENGYDRIEFLLSTNIGESPKPLAKIASGGEISRVMLAMKSVLAHTTDLPILIFDEIDTGISGAIADAVGRSLKKLARSHQIISITHLPQIAAMADCHFSVEKAQRGNRTISTVKHLNEKDHIMAVANLISGKKQSDSSLKAATELIEQANTAE